MCTARHRNRAARLHELDAARIGVVAGDAPEVDRPAGRAAVIPVERGGRHKATGAVEHEALGQDAVRSVGAHGRQVARLSVHAEQTERREEPLRRAVERRRAPL